MSEAVASFLNSKNISFTSSGKDYVIKCLNPEHEDSNPSCRVDKLTGLTHCFACGWRANIFKHFGVFTDNTSVKVAKLKKKIKDLRIASAELELPTDHVPFTQKHRNISSATYRKFGAFTTQEIEKLQDRIVFPIKDISNRTVSFLGRHILSDAKPRYEVYPSGVSLPLYPLIMDKNTKTIVLVEGIFDMLNLYDKGVTNAVCVFGTQGITEHSVETKMLAFKVQGIEKVYILFDGDDAGRKAASATRPLLEDQGFVVDIIQMEDGVDPGALDQDSVDLIRNYIDGN